MIFPAVTVKVFPNQKPWVDVTVLEALKAQITFINSIYFLALHFFCYIQYYGFIFLSLDRLTSGDMVASHELLA